MHNPYRLNIWMKLFDLHVSWILCEMDVWSGVFLWTLRIRLWTIWKISSPFLFYCHRRIVSGKHNVKETVPVLQAIRWFQLLHCILQVTGIPKTFIRTKVELLAFRSKFLSTYLNWIFCTNDFNNIFNLDSGKIYLRFLLFSRIRER